MNRPVAIILAAGKGTRMNSDLPKVAHEICGRAMVAWVVDACVAAGCTRIIVVVGHRQEVVRAALAEFGASGIDVEFVEQREQHGTGHAVMCARDAMRAEAHRKNQSVFVLAGDGPLIRPQTLKKIVSRHESTHAAATLATAVIDDPAGYGRIVRDAAGEFVAIVEHKNATEPQREIREVNPSYYCFEAAELFSALDCVKKNESSGEYYLTDVLEILLKDGKRVEVIEAVPPEDVLSINTPEQLREVDHILRRRLASIGAGKREDGR